MFPHITPRMVLILGVGLLSWALQTLTMEYLVRASFQHTLQIWQENAVQTTSMLANRINQALQDKNDLAALAVLQSARKCYPDLHTAMVFDQEGRIILHTDPDMAGKTVIPPDGFSPLPEISFLTLANRRLTQIQIGMPESGDIFISTRFDESSPRQKIQSIRVRLYLFSTAISLALVLLIWYFFKHYEIVNPLDASPLAHSSSSESTTSQAQHYAELLLTEMPHAVAAVSRDHIILAANALALEMLNCRREELIGMHILHAPLPSSLQEFYQQAIHTPEQSSKANLKLTPVGPAIPAKWICVPASGLWELALLTLG